MRARGLASLLAVAGLERVREGVIADDIAGEAGAAAEAVVVRESALGASAADVRGVGHFEAIGHVAGDTDVEDAEVHGIVDGVDDAADEDAGADGDGFAGFEVDGEVVAFADAFDETDEEVGVVAGFGDMVAAAHVEPFDLVEEVAEFGFDGVEGGGEGVGVLFAERVEVEPVESGEVFAFQFG